VSDVFHPLSTVGDETTTVLIVAEAMHRLPLDHVHESTAAVGNVLEAVFGATVQTAIRGRGSARLVW